MTPRDQERRRFAAEQPHDGDVVVHCGHLTDTSHWWKMAGEARAMRPDGSWLTPLWLVACEPCFQRARGNPEHVLVRGDGTWTGNAPTIKEPTSH